LGNSDQYQTVEVNIYFPPDSVKWEPLIKGSHQYTFS